MIDHYKQAIYGLLCLIVAPLLFSCSDDDDETSMANERFVEYFAFESFDPAVEGIIDNQAGTINITVPEGTDKTALSPTIRVSEGATVSPASGEAQDFSRFVIYTVTGADGAARNYTVLTEEGLSSNASITNLSFANKYVVGEIDEESREIMLALPFGSDLTDVELSIITAEEEAVVSPASGDVVDVSEPLTITVTAPDGVTEKTYTVSATTEAQETGIRGVWLTNVDSDVLNSQQGIQDAVALCSELNINTIFVVTYNRATTTYPSAVMENLTGVNIDPTYAGRDPLRELIDAAHAEDIKVFAWFEYGFAAFNGNPGPILNAKPEWAAINSDGNTVVKNGFYWMNSLLPEVQDFMEDLVLEVVRNYPDIDGIQGDDRLPAMPSEGGYDEYTVAEYRAEHNGQDPPANRQDPAWLRWRAERLNAWGEKLYNNVKTINPQCLVAMSPSPLNFGYVEYLQDYDSWVKGGYCDIVSPQLYRRDNQGLGVYRALLRDQISRVGQENVDIFFPGILSFLGGYVPEEQFLVDMIQENRRNGVIGEVHFFYNVLLARDDVFRVVYPGPMLFPNFN